MSYPNTTTTDPYAFSLWPDASEELAVWAEAAGYAQQNNSFTFDNLDATASWGQSATLPAATYDIQNMFETDWTTGGTGTVGDILGIGASVADATATDTIALAPAPALPFPTDLNALAQDCFFGEYDFSNSLSSTPALTNVSSVPSPQGDGSGNGIIPSPMSAGAPYLVQPSCPSSSSSQLDISGELQLDGLTFPPSSWFMGEDNLATPLPPDFLPLDLMSMIGDMSYPTQSNYTGVDDHMTAPTEALSTLATDETVFSPSSLGKRGREREGDESGLQKKSRQNATRVPGGAESTERARRSPVTRTQQKTNCKSKAVGRGAGKLASTTARGVYNRSLPGHNVSQGSMGALVQAQPSWIEEREVEMRHDTGSAAPQQIVPQSAENAEDVDLHEIPGNLSARQRSMLQTTQADEERGAVRHIKCKLCPTARFGQWETYKRHCKTCEKHPAELRFCPRCGDYFARPDSGKRHNRDKKHQEACINTPQAEAREKRQKVERLLREFEARLEYCLRTGEEIGPRFSDIVNKKLTNTSKKISKHESTWSEGDSWAAGLR